MGAHRKMSISLPHRVAGALIRLYVLLVLAVLFVHAGTPADAEQRAAHTRQAGLVNSPSGTESNSNLLTTADWRAIRTEYERNQNLVVPERDGHLARNSAQQWTTRFDGRGFVVTPESGNWSWGLSLQSFGPSGEQRTAENPVAVSAENDRLTYTWGEGVEEWFHNGPSGLEHGFTLRKSLSPDSGHLRFVLNVEGGLTPRATGSGLGVEFLDAASGAAVLRYDGLKVWDSRGTVLQASLKTAGNRIILDVNAQDAVYPITIDPIAQQAYLKASDAGADEYFGAVVAISGDTVVVGAPGKDVLVGSNKRTDAGVVYVFVRNGSSWMQQAVLQSQTPTTWGYFGWGVDIDGDTIVVGEEVADYAYVFVRNGGVWTQQARLRGHNTQSSDSFGTRVAISGDVIVVGALGEDSSSTGVNGANNNSARDSGAAYVFRRSGTTWTQEAFLKPSNTATDMQFGTSVDISGDLIAVSAPFESTVAYDSGAAYLFRYQNGSWTPHAKVKASNVGAGDWFGICLSLDGNTLVVGAPFESSNATGVNGNQSNNSATYSGAAYVFTVTGEGATQDAYLKASNTGKDDMFGLSVAVRGNRIAVGAPEEDGSSPGINGANNNSLSESGAVYLFTRVADNTWTGPEYIKPSNPGFDDIFGNAVALSDSLLLVGAQYEESGSSNPGDNSAYRAGAAYVFDLPLPPFQGIFDNPEIVSEDRRNRVVSRVEIRMEVVSTSDYAYPNIRASVNTNSDGHAVVPGSNIIQCGAVEAHETKICTGTFLLDWDRRHPLDMSSLQFEILP
jgi:hypothetical protein